MTTHSFEVSKKANKQQENLFDAFLQMTAQTSKDSFSDHKQNASAGQKSNELFQDWGNIVNKFKLGYR